MTSLSLTFIAAGCIVVGTLMGVWLQTKLPVNHLSEQSQETVRLAAGIIATMSALVLGLLVSSAKTSYDVASADVAKMGAKFISVNELLSEYGPETKPMRAHMKALLAERIDAIWHRRSTALSGLLASETSSVTKTLQNSLSGLVPSTEEQKLVLGQLWQINAEMRNERLLLIEQQQAGLPAMLLWLLVFWLTLLFASFGLFAPRNNTVIASLLIGALSVSSAIFLILEMGRPLEGLIQVSSAPMTKALELFSS